MKCADIMSTNLEWLTEKDSIQEAALQMAQAGIGFLPICDAQHRVVGVVTDRDLTIRALATRMAVGVTSVATIMTSPAISCLATADIRHAEELMAKEQKGRLVITDDDGALVGVLSLADLVEHAPSRQSLRTVRAVLWREALGPRAGAFHGDPMLSNDPIARPLPGTPDDMEMRPSVFTGGHRHIGSKEFPG